MRIERVERISFSENGTGLFQTTVDLLFWDSSNEKKNVYTFHKMTSCILARFLLIGGYLFFKHL